MTPIITYSLRLEAQNSDDYYRNITAFADQWLAGAMSDVGGIVAGFRDCRQASGRAGRSEAECAFELLALGVMLREHGCQAARLARFAWLARALNWLVAAQDRWPWSEGIVKVLRGWLGWLGRHGTAWRPKGGDDIGRIIRWLTANGESARAERFAQWQDYFDEIGPQPAQRIISRCLTLAADFAADSGRTLGKYTEGVEQFVSGVALARYRWRYDAEFVSRSRLEYHLGMLGTEILSRAYRERFLAAKRKIVIVPPCMRAQPEEKCKAIPTPFGVKCQACTLSCRVHQITKLGEKRGFAVYIIPDELRVFGSGVGDGSLGVVGVSCALTNWSGGWDADALGVPAQGVLLDYVGCKFHWDEKGIPTDTNLKKLEEMLRT